MDVTRLFDLEARIGKTIDVFDLADVVRVKDGKPCLRVTVDGLLTDEEIEKISRVKYVVAIQECHHVHFPELRKSVIMIAYD